MKLVIAGGGTGGHVYPGIAVAEEIRSRGGKVVFIGTERGLESRIVPAAGFPLLLVPASGLLRRRLFQNIGALVVNGRGVIAARRHLLGSRPDVVLGMGGFASFAAGAAARLLGIPLVIHEQNAVPGLANRVLTRFAARTLTSWAGAEPGREGRSIRVGLPIRAAFRSADPDAARQAARASLGLHPDERLVVIFGGSRGARSLNDAVAAWLASPSFAAVPRLIVLWATGVDHVESFRPAAVAAGPRLRLVPYIERMPEILPAADLAVTRSGAMTLAELTLCGIPSILVPYPYATGDHQTANARALVDAGAAVLVPDDVISARLGETIADLVENPGRRRVMASAARKLGNPQAAVEIADILETLARNCGLRNADCGMMD